MPRTAARRAEEEIEEQVTNGGRLEIERLLAKKKEGLTPADLVGAARNPKSALHGMFVWDDSLAGVQYRLYQARVILQRFGARSYNVRITKRELLNVEIGDGRRYVARSTVLMNQDLRGQEIERAWKHLRRFVDEWGDAAEYPELERVTRAIGRAIPKTI